MANNESEIATLIKNSRSVEELFAVIRENISVLYPDHTAGQQSFVEKKLQNARFTLEELERFSKMEVLFPKDSDIRNKLNELMKSGLIKKQSAIPNEAERASKSLSNNMKHSAKIARSMNLR